MIIRGRLEERQGDRHAERDQDHVSMVIWNIRKRWINRRHWLEAVPHRYRPCWKELPL